MDLLGNGSSGDPPAWLTPAEVARLEPVLDGAALLGVELEPRYRVLALTVEPHPDHYVWQPRPRDVRLQVLASPVSTMLVTLRRAGAEGARELLTFAEEQLLEVVAALDGPPLTSPILSQPEPRPGEWGPRFSLEGRSTAPDGTGRSLRIEVARDELWLGLFARFDQVEVRDATGSALRLPS
ncbi:MAG: hypothetical protein ACLFUG_04690 [Nitriliruptoraceae bacterium]